MGRQNDVTASQILDGSNPSALPSSDMGQGERFMDAELFASALIAFDVQDRVRTISPDARLLLRLGADGVPDLYELAHSLFGAKAERLLILWTRARQQRVQRQVRFVTKLGASALRVDIRSDASGEWTVRLCNPHAAQCDRLSGAPINAAQIDALLQVIPHGCAIFDADMKLIACNSQFVGDDDEAGAFRQPGITHDELVGKLARAKRLSEDDARRNFGFIKKAMRENCEQRFRMSPADDVQFDIIVRPVAGGGFAILHQDVSTLVGTSRENARKGEELALHHSRFKLAVDHMAQGLAMFDAQGRLVICNDNYLDIYGLPTSFSTPGTRLRSILKHENVSQLIGLDGGQRFFDLLMGVMRLKQPYHEFLVLEDGRHIELRVTPMADGGFVSTHVDVTEKRKQEKRNRYLARHDSLTDLPNRLQFSEQLAAALKQAESGMPFALLCFDLDQFKQINDTLGHSAGDHVLQTISGRVQSWLEPSDFAARMGGDEICVVLQNVGDEQNIANRVQSLIARIAHPISFDGHKIDVGASFGIARAPLDGVSEQELMRKADLALYKAKGAGRGGYAFYTRDTELARERKQYLSQRLLRAIEDKEFSLELQPVFDVRQRRIRQFHLRLRWQQDDGVVLAGRALFKLIEGSGLVKASHQNFFALFGQAIASLPSQVMLAMDVPAELIKDHISTERLLGHVAKLGLAPERLDFIFEQEDRLTLEDDLARQVDVLRGAGIGLTMSDFDAGARAIGLVERGWFDRVKMSGALVDHLDASPMLRTAAGHVWSILETAQVDLIADGIVREEQLQFFADLGGYLAQGKLLAPYMPLTTAAQLYEVTEDRLRKRNQAESELGQSALSG